MEQTENSMTDLIDVKHVFSEIETNNYKAISEVCELAIRKKKMIGITGYPGAGKTTSLTNIGFKYNAAWQNYTSKKADQYTSGSKYPPRVIYVSAKPSMQPKDLFRDIFSVLGSTHYDYSLNSIIRNCMEAFMGCIASSEGGLIIIDECGKLSQKQLELIHEFRDLSGNGFGIILSGPESFHLDFKDMIKKGRRGMAELYSRINNWVEMTRPSKAEIAAIIKANEITDDTFTARCIGQCSDFRKLHTLIMDYKDNIE